MVEQVNHHMLLPNQGYMVNVIKVYNQLTYEGLKYGGDKYQDVIHHMWEGCSRDQYEQLRTYLRGLRQ